MKILAVDDDKHVRDLLSLVLKKQGYIVQTENDVESGIEAFVTGSYDLVLTDICLPGQDGNVLAEYIHDSELKVPVVALTGNTEKAIAQFDHILSKPFYSRDLLKVVKKLLSSQCRTLG